MSKPRYGNKVHRGMGVLAQALDKDLLGSVVCSEGYRGEVAREDVRAAIRYVRQLVEWEEKRREDRR